MKKREGKMVDFTAVNNKRHFDIAIASLNNVTNEHPLIIKAITWILKRWSNQCEDRTDKAWIKECDGINN